MRTIITFMLLPMAVFLLLLGGGCGGGMRFVFSSTPEMVGSPDQAGLTYEEVWFPTADGVRLHGWLVQAEGDKPLVLFFHGNAANISYRVENLAYLHGLGYPVFIFDYRGFGRSEGRALSEENLQEDARAALGWLGERGWTPDRMIYFGRSMGAAVALSLALETPPAGLVMECPFTSLAEMARHLTPITYALVGWWGIGNEFDNLGRIGGLTRPLLIIQGDQDRTVLPEMAHRLYERAREPKTLLIVPGAGHSDAHAAGGELYRRAWLGFTEKLSSPKPLLAVPATIP